MSETIRIFDPAMCCPTGVCGPGVDPDLARFAADLDWLRGQGVTVERYNLAQQPGAFAGSAPVKAALEARGTECLPLLLIEERVAAEGVYPTREALAAMAGVVVRAPAEPAKRPCCPPKATSPDGKSGSGCC